MLGQTGAMPEARQVEFVSFPTGLGRHRIDPAYSWAVICKELSAFGLLGPHRRYHVVLLFDHGLVVAECTARPTTKSLAGRVGSERLSGPARRAAIAFVEQGSTGTSVTYRTADEVAS